MQHPARKLSHGRPVADRCTFPNERSLPLGGNKKIDNVDWIPSEWSWFSSLYLHSILNFLMESHKIDFFFYILLRIDQFHNAETPPYTEVCTEQSRHSSWCHFNCMLKRQNVHSVVIFVIAYCQHVMQQGAVIGEQRSKDKFNFSWRTIIINFKLVRHLLVSWWFNERPTAMVVLLYINI